jgi:hypothetical protein
MFTNAWLEDALQRVLHPHRPTLTNSDGDTIVFTTVRYPVKADTDRDKLRDRLSAIPGFRPSGGGFWNWVAASPDRVADKHAAGADRLKTQSAEGSVVLGQIALENDALKLEINSPQRADKARALLESALGDLIGEPEVEAMTVEEAMARRDSREEADLGSEPPSPDDYEMMHGVLDRHYRGLLDEPVPALNDMSPREAATTGKGRKILVNWLKGLEKANAQHEPGSPIATYDLSWMWEELGVSKMRR